MRAMVAVLIAAAAMGSCNSDGSGPDANAPAALEVARDSALLVSLDDTLQLEATVRNAASQDVAAAVMWAAEPAGIVSVDANGRVVALANGVAVVTASVGILSADATVVVEQAVDSLVMSGDAQAADVGTPLDSSVVVTLLDARGNAIAGAPVAFQVASGGGDVSSASGTTGSDGSEGVVWTLGTTAGLQELDVAAGFNAEASHRFTAHAYALEATVIALLSGNEQSEITATPLAAPLQVVVTDSLGNGVADVLVTFVATGDAVLEAPEVSTDLDGVASVALTLGSTVGDYTIMASVADSLTVTGQPLAGSPVTFQASAVSYAVTPVAELVVGDTVTITGSGFHPSLAANTVLRGGAPAVIIDGNQTEL